MNIIINFFKGKSKIQNIDSVETQSDSFETGSNTARWVSSWPRLQPVPQGWMGSHCRLMCM